jgi:transcriptional antiterminator NusG
LEKFIPEVMIPYEKVYVMRNGKKKIKERNYFPGYVLVSADFSHGEVQHVIKNVPGVIGFLGSGSGPSRVPIPLRQSEINRIFGKFDESNDEDAIMSSPFIVGEDVKVMDGPFNGFTGSIAQIFEDRKKLNVTVKIFGRSTPVELNYFQVEKSNL